SSADTATPPALAALAGPNDTPAFWKTSIASSVDGILAPSVTAITPLAARVLASSSLISFCVAHGKARSALIDQIEPSPAGVKVALGRASAYLTIRARSSATFTPAGE